MRYWYYYSSEEFSARVFAVSDDWHPKHYDLDFTGHYHGPFRTIKECRSEVLAKISSDIGEFKRMKSIVQGKPTTITVYRGSKGNG